MGKKRRSKSQNHRAKLPPTSYQLVLTSIISRISGFLTLTPIMMVAYLFTHYFHEVDEARHLVAICVLLVGFALSAKPFFNAKIREIADEAYIDHTVHLQFRKNFVWLLSLSFFINIMLLIPILYFKGYITQWAAYLSDKQLLSDNLSLVGAFLAGAVVSGVAGNFTYDILKYIVQKASKRKKK